VDTPSLEVDVLDSQAEDLACARSSENPDREHDLDVASKGSIDRRDDLLLSDVGRLPRVVRRSEEAPRRSVETEDRIRRELPLSRFVLDAALAEADRILGRK
jgi:hypothetical protein